LLQIPKRTLYAVEAVVDIACHARPDPVQSKDIARRQGIPRRYLEPVMQQLVKAGLLRGVRGPKGGYRLARERRRITLGEVVRVFRAEDAEEERLGHGVAAPLWRELEAAALAKLDAVTIEDLCCRAEAAVSGARESKGSDFSI
jgi:Rrf2 family protein